MTSAAALEQRLESNDDPDLTLLRDHRLVAKVWRRDEQGHMRRAGHRGTEPICEVPFADIITFDTRQDAFLAELIESSGDEEAFLFKLELEGFRVVEGAVAPHLHLRRF